MAYQLYKRPAFRADSPSFTLSTGGRIGTKAAAVRVMVKAGVKAVVLLWDKDSNNVAIKAAHRNDDNSYAVSLAADNHSGNIQAKSFLAHIGWSGPKQTVRAEWNEKERMFELTLPPYPGILSTNRKIKVMESYVNVPPNLDWFDLIEYYAFRCLVLVCFLLTLWQVLKNKLRN